MSVPLTLKHRERTARKKHVCSYCGEYIEAGEKYQVDTLIWGGDIYDWKSHYECQFIADELWEYIDPDEGMTDEDFREGCRNFCSCFVCPDCDHFDRETEYCVDDCYYCTHKIYELLRTYELIRSRDKQGFFCFRLKPRRAENERFD